MLFILFYIRKANIGMMIWLKYIKIFPSMELVFIYLDHTRNELRISAWQQLSTLAAITYIRCKVGIFNQRAWVGQEEGKSGMPIL